MSINTKTVAGRRELHFDSFDELLAEAERLSDGDVQLLGNWSLAQILTHLAAGINSAIDGSTFRAPFLLRLIVPLMKKKFIYGGIPPGFQIPKKAERQFLPPEIVETTAALDALHRAIERLQAASELAPHPLFGQLTKEEAIQFQLRHAEMHLSFAVPAQR